jgi:hypothetical protein
MPYIRIDVDLNKIYDEMDQRDKETMAGWLIEDEIIKSDSFDIGGPTPRTNDESWEERELRNNLTLIWNSYHRLTHEEEELIKKIASRL